jgi:hypothetical protein
MGSFVVSVTNPSATGEGELLNFDKTGVGGEGRS